MGMPDLLTAVLLLAAGLVGGALNTLAGGGSFIVFPALLAAGVPPVVANASNTYAALPGYISGAVGYWSAGGSSLTRSYPSSPGISGPNCCSSSPMRRSGASCRG
jgi:uncharacterized membrane protein YfcA